MRWPGILSLCLVLVACAGEPPRAPVEARQGVERQKTSTGRYTVARGDTLFAIAWRYGLDYRMLARANNIAPPYTIYPGQLLSLNEMSPPASDAAPARPSAVAPAPVPAPAAQAKPVTRPAPVTQPSSSRGIAGDSRLDTAPVNAWLWPTSGPIVRKFSGTVHKGIDIGGKAGDRVVATAAGKVVYAGSGIVGYGKLLIVKHNDQYLSAYGHNRRLLVDEGSTVTAGQVIAEKGSSATNSVKLHFEVRSEGKPVDPVKLLPGRE